MTKSVSAFQWVPLANTQDYSASISCDTGVDNTWQISCNGGVDDRGSQIVPLYALVDNMANGALATVFYGPFVFQVPAFTRKLFRLPVPTNYITVNGTTGIITVILLTNPAWVNEDANLLAIQKASLGNVTYPFVVYNAVNQPQQTSDFQKSVELAPTIANMNYDLLAIAANSLANGQSTIVSNNGTKIAFLTPAGGDTLNALFTNATPLALYPGENGWLSTDGAQWFFFYFTRKRATIASGLAAIAQSPNDDGKRIKFTGAVAQTYTLLAVGNFQNGFRTAIENTGSAWGAFAPNGADTINGVNANFAVPPGGKGELYIDDTGQWHFDGNFLSAGQFTNVASGSIPIPANLTSGRVRIFGAFPVTNTVITSLRAIDSVSGVLSGGIYNYRAWHADSAGSGFNAPGASAQTSWALSSGTVWKQTDTNAEFTLEFAVVGTSVRIHYKGTILAQGDIQGLAGSLDVTINNALSGLLFYASAGNVTFNYVLSQL